MVLDEYYFFFLVAFAALVAAGFGVWVYRRAQQDDVPELPDALHVPRPEVKKTDYQVSKDAVIDTSGGTDVPKRDDDPAEVDTAYDEQPIAPADLTDLVPEQPVLPPVESPDAPEGRLVRLRARLSRSQSAFSKALLGLLQADSLDEEAWEDLEDSLLAADLGVESATEIVEKLRQQAQVSGIDEQSLEGWLQAALLEQVDPGMDRRIAAARRGDVPAVVLVVGVNGVGKTTTVGKLARVLVAQDKDVILGAADTFRAAAADQLQTWGERVGVPTVRADREGADPASVAFEAVAAGIEGEVDVVVLDTAGRLHNNVGLMDQLAKIKRVVNKRAEITEVLLVLDATTGQNGMRQAEAFAQAVDITGIALTKMDGTAKGGIVVNVQKTLGVPVKLVGLGEGPDDLAPFEPEAFVSALLG